MLTWLPGYNKSGAPMSCCTVTTQPDVQREGGGTGKEGVAGERREAGCVCTNCGQAPGPTVPPFLPLFIFKTTLGSAGP